VTTAIVNHTKNIGKNEFSRKYTCEKCKLRLTAMKSQKVQELSKKENPNIFKKEFQIATPHPHNTQNGVL
jgi:hypothetical protein